jgi:hypothetical protein
MEGIRGNNDMDAEEIQKTSGVATRGSSGRTASGEGISRPLGDSRESYAVDTERECETKKVRSNTERVHENNMDKAQKESLKESTVQPTVAGHNHTLFVCKRLPYNNPSHAQHHGLHTLALINRKSQKRPCNTSCVSIGALPKFTQTALKGKFTAFVSSDTQRAGWVITTNNQTQQRDRNKCVSNHSINSKKSNCWGWTQSS